MLASDSDSDFEYPADAINSDASDDGVLLGKLALGIDPQEMKSYDGRSTPQNGSQFLLKMMQEKKSVPKVVCADMSKISVKKADMANPDYLERFLKRCGKTDTDVNEEEVNVNTDSKLLPSSKWREETVSDFSKTRLKVERWHSKIEAREFKIYDKYPIPTSNDNIHWLKFCFGDAFLKLAMLSKSSSSEEKIENFFLNMYDANIAEQLQDGSVPGNAMDDLRGGGDSDKSSSLTQPESENGANGLATVKKEVNAEHDIQIRNDPSGKEGDTKAELKSDKSPIRMGHRPLMNLIMQFDQAQLESLVRYNLMWLNSIGFINECQGQWLYAILGSILKPVEPSVMSDIRSIARILIKTRNSMSFWSESKDVGTSGNDQAEGSKSNENEKLFSFINTLNLFIFIIADYFGQKDLIMKL